MLARKDSPMVLGIADGETYLAFGCTGNLKPYEECLLYWKSWKWPA